jgi:aspartokinase
MDKHAVSNISTTYNVALVTVDNLPNNMKLISDIFNTIAQEKINVDMISQAPPYKGSINVSFSIPSDDITKAIGSLNKYKKDVPNLHVEVDADNTKISVYGEEMKNIPGVAARLFTILANLGIEVKLITTSEVDISYLISMNDVDKALDAIKSEYKL